jgi:ADP-ribose pyrophosphatase
MAKNTGPLPPAPPAHPDLDVIEAKTGFARHLQVDVVRFRQRRFDGAWSGERVFDICRRGAAAAVLLYDPKHDQVVLIEQFRLAALYGGRSPWQIEVVAGLVDKGEPPEAVARREAVEEAGLAIIGPLVPIQSMLPACGSFDEIVWLYCGRIDARGAGGVYGLAEEHEDIRVLVKTIPEIEDMLEQGRIDSAHTLISLYWLLRHRDRLRREWRAGVTPNSPS